MDKKVSTLFVAEIYRVPNTNENMPIERYGQSIAILSGSNRVIIIGTDQNVDYLKVYEHNNTSDKCQYYWNIHSCSITSDIYDHFPIISVSVNWCIQPIKHFNI